MKKKIKRIIKKIIRNICYLFIGLFASVYYSILGSYYFINKINTKLLVKVNVVLGIICLCSFLSLITINKIANQETITTTNEVSYVAIDGNNYNTIKTPNLTNDNEIKIFQECIKQGLSVDQAMIVMSISKQETGYWRSNAFVNYYNFGGIMTSKGLKAYDSYEQGLENFVTILRKYYFEIGLDTIEKIGAKYCPVGASNDPNGLNNYWVVNVTYFYNQYLESYSI